MNQQICDERQKETLMLYIDNIRDSYLKLSRLSNLEVYRDCVEKTDYGILLDALSELHCSIQREIKFYEKYSCVKNSEVE